MQRALPALLLLATLAAAPAPAAGELELRWLGVAGFSLQDGEAVVLHDPYFSRPGLWRTLFSRYEPDSAVLEPLLEDGSPAPELRRAGLILVGHSHFDHLGDVPWLSLRTGARIVGSPTTAALSRGYGAAEESLLSVSPGDTTSHGPFEIRVVESRHAKVLMGRVPLPGEVLDPPAGPVHAVSMKMGGALGYWVQHRPSGVSLFLLSSAGLHPPAIEALGAEVGPVDVLLPATQGRSEGYAALLVRHLRPRVVIPHHFDSFFRALADPAAAEPSDEADLQAFESELHAAAASQGLSLQVVRPQLWKGMELRKPEP